MDSSNIAKSEVRYDETVTVLDISIESISDISHSISVQQISQKNRLHTISTNSVQIYIPKV